MTTTYRAIADYYDPEYAHLDYLDRDVPFYLRHLPKKRRHRVLELGCGTGRAAIPLAQAGHRVTGVDYAADMLAIARHKRDSVGLTDRDLRLVRANLLKLDLGEQFDDACIFFNSFLSFTTLAEQDRVLQNTVRHIKPGGTFWIDVFNPDVNLLARGDATDLDPLSFYVSSFDRTVFRVTDVARHAQRLQTQRITFRYQWFDRDGVDHYEQNSFLLTHIFPRELQLLLERHGLNVLNLFGDHDGSLVTDLSPRLIAHCRKGGRR
jgi:SAM-dependent methyltransferase